VLLSCYKRMGDQRRMRLLSQYGLLARSLQQQRSGARWQQAASADAAAAAAAAAACKAPTLPTVGDTVAGGGASPQLGALHLCPDCLRASWYVAWHPQQRLEASHGQHLQQRTALLTVMLAMRLLAGRPAA
jgi:hypothetical protein